MTALYLARPVENGTEYHSRLSGRRYFFERERGFVGVYVVGRCIYRGQSPERAFKMIELDDCAA